MSRHVVFKNELTICNIGDMANELLNAIQCDRDVTVDLSGVERIDSAALQVLVGAVKEAKIIGGQLTCLVPNSIKVYASSFGVLL